MSGHAREATGQDWLLALEQMNDRLVSGWAALSAGEVEMNPFVPPAGLGPLPADLRAAATRLLAETQALEAALRHRSDAIGRELVMTQRVSDEPRARPQFFDRAL